MTELDLLAAAAPPLPDPAQVVPADERSALFMRITGAAPAPPASPATPFELLPAEPRRRRPRRVAVLAAAAAVAVAATGAALALRPGDGTQPVLGPRPAPAHTAVPFALPTRSGYVVVEAAANPAGVMVAGHGGIFLLNTYASARDAGLLTDGAQMIRVGTRPGFYGCLHSDPPPPWSQCANGEVAWEYRPGAWAVASGEFVRPTRSSLLAVARAVDFTQATPARSPIRVARPPLDGTLLSWDVTYRAANRGETAARLLHERGWMVEATYADPASGHWIGISAFPSSVPRHPGDRPVTVGRHHGLWNADDHRLRVDLGGGVELIVAEANADAGRHVLTLDVARRIAATVTITPHIADRTTWFPLASALPTG